MKILIVEDDHIQSDWIRQNLEEAFPGGKIEEINTESQFRSRLDEIAKYLPDVIILDVMLRWTDPGPDMQPPPSEIQAASFYRAGLRCRELLANDGRTKDIPVVLYTVLESYDLESDLKNIPGRITYLRKEPDPAALIQQIRDLT